MYLEYNLLSHLNDIGTVQLETERLILRKAVVDDYIDVYNNWTSIEEVSKYANKTVEDYFTHTHTQTHLHISTPPLT